MSITFIRAYCVPIFHSRHDSLLQTLRPNISCHLPCFLECYFQIVKLKNKICSLYPCFHLKNTGQMPGGPVVKNLPANAGDLEREDPTCPGPTKPVHRNY